MKRYKLTGGKSGIGNNIAKDTKRQRVMEAKPKADENHMEESLYSGVLFVPSLATAG